MITLKIPVNDHFKTDRPNLPCKIIEKLYKNNYRLGCKSEILEIIYNGNNLEPIALNTVHDINIQN